MASKRGSLNQRQWLNVIIVVVSAIFLLLLSLGKLIEKNDNAGADSEGSISIVQLERIDFGRLTLWYQNGRWLSTSQQLSQIQIDTTINNWERLLQTAGEPFFGEPPSGQNVLLYLRHVSQPVICKLSRRDDKIMITFVANAQQFTFAVEAIDRFVPRID